MLVRERENDASRNARRDLPTGVNNHLHSATMLDHAEFLRGHPIFTRNELDTPFDLSLTNLPSFKENISGAIRPGTRNGAGRRSIMALRESDILLAVGNEIRIASLSDARTLNKQQRSYKVFYMRSIYIAQFTSTCRYYTHQMSNLKYAKWQ